MPWIVAWEQQSTGPHQTEAASEQAAEAKAQALIHQGIRRVVFYEVDGDEEGAA